MGIPSRPKFLIEGPAAACIVHGQKLGWKNCTCLSFAMGIDKSTLGRIRLTGCDVREQTNDWAGGTTIEQCAVVAEAHGVHVEIHTGANVAIPYYAGVQLQAGRGFSLAGNCTALGKGNVNHNVWVNEASGGTMGNPANVLVYDPWSTGPAWWTWAKAKAFAAALHPWGESDPRLLGPGKFYCGIFPDTEPHFHSKFSGRATSPFPDKLFGKKGTSQAARYVRPGPGLQYQHIRVLSVGAPFGAYQVTTGGTWNGSNVWYGDHNGIYWIHASGVTGAGVKP